MLRHGGGLAVSIIRCIIEALLLTGLSGALQLLYDRYSLEAEPVTCAISSGVNRARAGGQNAPADDGYWPGEVLLAWLIGGTNSSSR